MKTEILQIRMSEREKTTLRALAEQNDMSMTKYLMSLVDKEQTRKELEAEIREKISREIAGV